MTPRCRESTSMKPASVAALRICNAVIASRRVRSRVNVTLALCLAVTALAAAPAYVQAGSKVLLGEWTVRFTPSNLNGKGINIRRPATLINGLVIQPGAQFDFVKAAGPFTLKNGYVTGAAIVNGEIKPDGVLAVIVPYNNIFRRVVTNNMLRAFYLLSRLRGRPLAFTEFRYTRDEMEGFLRSTGFAITHREPDDFRLPWAKGLSLDLGPWLRPAGAGPDTWELNALGRTLARALNALSPWSCCAGILLIARKA